MLKRSKLETYFGRLIDNQNCKEMNWRLFPKKVRAYCLYYSGMIPIIRSFNNEHIILAYHRVLPKDDECIKDIEPGMYVTTETFAMHMRYVSRHYEILSLDELIKYPKVKKACAITFDDGWYDNYAYAYPILKHYKVPATIFLTTNKIGTNEWPWPDRLNYYIHKSSQEDFEKVFSFLNNELGMCSEKEINSLTSYKTRSFISSKYITKLKGISERRLQSLMANVDSIMMDLREVLYKNRPWINWIEINEMVANGIDFGSHTHSHVILTNTDLKHVIEEINISRDLIKKNLGKETYSFSYPNGNYNDIIVDALRKSGYKIAVTTKRGAISKSDDYLILRRILVHEDVTNSIPLFALKIIMRNS